MAEKKISGVPTCDFKDEGTGKRFTKGEAQKFDAGVHANYLAAGLIAADTADAAAEGGEPAA